MKRRFVLALASIVLAVGIAIPVVSQAQSASRLLVAFRSGVPTAARTTLLRSTGATRVEGIYGAPDVWVVSGNAAALSRSPLVRYVEPDKVLHISVSAPNDPQYSQQYAMQKINAVAGWTSYPGAYTASGGPKVAMIDTGIDTTHPDLVGHIDTADAKCFGVLCILTGYEDDNGHGSHTSGTVGAATNNGVGVAGVAFNTSLMPIKVCNAAGSCQTADIVSGINWARTHGAKVISMSLGGGGTATLQTAVTQANNAGVVVVAAAGNDGNSNVNYPAGYAEVISVAATDSNDAHASFSNTNADVELAAPGVNVLSTYSGDSYTTLSGTSMATPHVAGLAALLVGQNPGWTNVQVRNRMDSCSDDLGAAGRDTTFGFGRINLGRALGGC